jgi:HAD superfamily hydrolase (TIGR01509 family)
VIDLVIFDCDGVLVDSESIGCRIDATLLTEVGYPITAAQVIARFSGISFANMIAAIEADMSRPLPADFVARSEALVWAAYEAELAALPGVADAVRALARPVCVASSSEPESLRRKLAMTGLLALFDPHLFSGAQVKRGKPAPDLFHFAADTMGVGPDRCLVVEDSVAGVTAARAAGMRVLGFTGAGHCPPDQAARLAAAGAVTVFDNLRDLPDLVG